MSEDPILGRSSELVFIRAWANGSIGVIDGVHAVEWEYDTTRD